MYMAPKYSTCILWNAHTQPSMVWQYPSALIVTLVAHIFQYPSAPGVECSSIIPLYYLHQHRLQDVVSAQELQEMKTLLLALLDHPTNVAKLIPGYTYPIVIYLMSVYSLELLRIQQAADIETFNKLFDYLEDRALQGRRSVPS